MELIEKIKKTAPDATVSENGEPVVSVSAQELHQVAEALYADSEHPMDYLRDIVGMDWAKQDWEPSTSWNRHGPDTALS